jgi:ribosomal protein L11 methyltransferase
LTGTPRPASAAERHASGPGAGWIELSVTADQEAVEAVAAILSRVSPSGVVVEPAYELVNEGLAAKLDSTRPVAVRGYVPVADRASAALAIRETRRSLGHLQAFRLRPIGPIERRLVTETDWTTPWRRHFPVLRVGERLVIRPSWRRHRPAPGDVVLALDPGVAFGTGLHPTTRLCLAGIEAWEAAGLVSGARVLDVGCGSGILALAAARLGAAKVLGIDIDPLAVEATHANARRNHVARRVRARQGSVPSGEEAFDLVVANLVASVLIELAAQLHAEVRPATGGTGPGGTGGRLLASGIFADRESDVRVAFAAAGFHVLGRVVDGDWVSLEAERVDPPCPARPVRPALSSRSREAPGTAITRGERRGVDRSASHPERGAARTITRTSRTAGHPSGGST